MNFKRYHVSKNILPSADSESKSSDNIVVKCDGNGRYHVYGTTSNATITIYFDIPSFVIPVSVGNGGNGTFSIFNTYTGGTNTGLLLYNGSTLIDTWGLASLNRTSTTYSTMGGKTITKLGISIAANQTIDGYMSPMFTNDGQLPSEFEPYSSEVWHDIPHYIHKTSTDTITTLPADIYANDTTATVGLKGQMEQSSQPSPTTPIQPSETGDKTANLCDESTIQNGYYGSSGSISTFTSDDRYRAFSMAIKAGTYTIKIQADEGIRLLRIATANEFYNVQEDNKAYTFTISADATMYVSWRNLSTTSSFTNMTVMLNTGSTALPYEPYGQYKIPILNNSQTTNVYLGEVQTTRKIKKLVLDGTEDWTISSAWKKTNTSVFYFPVSDIGGASDYERYILSTHFASKSRTELYRDDIEGISKTGSNAVTVRVDDTIATTVNDFKEWLRDNNVTIWYVLTSETTGIVNEPLRKIGDYADEVSGISIPTIAGANTLSVDTTLQPSEVTVNYKGWHPVADVHEKSRNLFDYQAGTPTAYKYLDENGNEVVVTESAPWYITDYIPIPDGVLSVTLSKIGGGSPAMCAYDASKNYITGIKYNTGSAVTKVDITLTSSTPIRFIRFSYFLGSTGYDDLSTKMLNTGGTALPYEPYWT